MLTVFMRGTTFMEESRVDVVTFLSDRRLGAFCSTS